MRRPSIVTVICVVLVAACSPASPSRAPSAPASSAPVASPAPASARPSPGAGSSASADPAGVAVDVAVVVGGLADPLDVTHAGDGSGRIFVVEQAGRIRIVRDGAVVERPFLDITDRVRSGGERGLLGLAFHPDYPADPRFVVDYTDGDGDTVIATFRVGTDGDVADPATETVLLRIDQPFTNHNGGAVAFGPDGMLYVGMGDGGSAGDPQGNGRKLGTLLAKILRIGVDAAGVTPYTVPSDNPFVNVAGARPEIWATGMRNPWRFRFDRTTGDLWIGDVGQGQFEEIDVARAGVGGQDFGWNTMEGFHCFQPADGCDTTGLTLPVTEYRHPAGCAVVGGVVVRDPRAGRLDGLYLFGDACTDTLWAISPGRDERREPVVVGEAGRSLSAIGEGEDGSVYATSLEGTLLRISSRD